MAVNMKTFTLTLACMALVTSDELATAANALSSNEFLDTPLKQSVKPLTSSGQRDIASGQIHARSSGTTDYVFGNLSSLFGWQMAGAAASQDQTAAACADISSEGHGKWAAIGLDPDSIRGKHYPSPKQNQIGPLCDSSASSPNPNTSISPIITYTTSILTTQLLASFNSTGLYTYLCSNLKFNLLEDFLLNDTAVISTICQAAGQQTPPRPFGPGPSGGEVLNSAAAMAVRNSGSVLFAFILAAGATTNSELNVLCAHAPMYVGNLDTEVLNGTAFQETLCAIHEPVSVGEAVDGIVMWLTRIYITVVENVSNVNGYVEWLCGNVDVESMSGAGLDGVVVQQTLCADCKAN